MEANSKTQNNYFLHFFIRLTISLLHGLKVCLKSPKKFRHRNCHNFYTLCRRGLNFYIVESNSKIYNNCFFHFLIRLTISVPHILKVCRKLPKNLLRRNCHNFYFIISELQGLKVCQKSPKKFFAEIAVTITRIVIHA